VTAFFFAFEPHIQSALVAEAWILCLRREFRGNEIPLIDLDFPVLRSDFSLEIGDLPTHIHHRAGFGKNVHRPKNMFQIPKNLAASFWKIVKFANLRAQGVTRKNLQLIVNQLNVNRI
jgi:hypothetical protein